MVVERYGYDYQFVDAPKAQGSDWRRRTDYWIITKREGIVCTHEGDVAIAS